MAGTEVRVALDMRDRFGNVSASRSEQHVAVEATGACTAPFEEFTTDSFRCAVAGLPGGHWSIRMSLCRSSRLLDDFLVAHAGTCHTTDILLNGMFDHCTDNGAER